MPVRGVYPLFNQWYDANGEEVTAMLPDVKRDVNGCYYPNVTRERTGDQRMRLAYGTIRHVENLPTGRTPSDAIRSFIRPLGLPTDHAGHIIPACLNGSGSHRDNFFPQHGRVNQGLGSIERRRKRDLREGGYDLQFLFVFSYPDDEEQSDDSGIDDDYETEDDPLKYPNRPISVLQSVKYSKNGKVLCEATYCVLNPMGNRYTILIEDDLPESVSFEQFFRTTTMQTLHSRLDQQHYLKVLNMVPVKQGPRILGAFCNMVPDRSFFTKCVQVSALTGLAILAAKGLPSRTQTPTARPVNAHSKPPIPNPFRNQTAPPVVDIRQIPSTMKPIYNQIYRPPVVRPQLQVVRA